MVLYDIDKVKNRTNQFENPAFLKGELLEYCYRVGNFKTNIFQFNMGFSRLDFLHFNPSLFQN